MNALRGMTLYSQWHKGMYHSTPMSTIKINIKKDYFTTNNRKFIVFGMFSSYFFLIWMMAVSKFYITFCTSFYLSLNYPGCRKMPSTGTSTASCGLYVIKGWLLPEESHSHRSAGMPYSVFCMQPCIFTLVTTWPSGKLSFDCQKIAKNLTYF